MSKDKKLPKGIMKRSDTGNYRGRFKYQNIQYTLENRDLKILMREMEDLKYEVRHGLRGKCDNITLDSWFDTWLDIHKKNKIKESTYARYKDYYCRYIQKQLGKRKISDFKPIILERLFQDMADKDYSTKTKDIRVLTVDEQREIVTHAKGRLHENLILIALGTGMRSGELLGLTWDDVNWDKREIYVNKTLVHIKDSATGKYTFKYQTPKTKNGTRTIPMQQSVYNALKQQHIKLKELQIASTDWSPLEHFENLVFAGQNGKPITEHQFHSALNWIEKSINKERMKIAEINGTPYTPIPHFYPHALRHTFATRCFEAGIEAKVVQGYLGHYSIAITLDTYTHITDDKSKIEMNKLENLYQHIV